MLQSFIITFLFEHVERETMTVIEYATTERDPDWMVAKIEEKGAGTLMNIAAELEDLIPVQRQLLEHKLYKIVGFHTTKRTIHVAKYDEMCHCFSHSKYISQKWSCNLCVARYEKAKEPTYFIDRTFGVIKFSINHPLILQSGLTIDPNFAYSIKLTPELEAHLYVTYGEPVTRDLGQFV